MPIGHLIEENQQHIAAFFKTNMFKERMKKFFALLAKEKTVKNEWENDVSEFLLVLYSAFERIRTILFC